MKKLSILFILLILLFSATGCENSQEVSKVEAENKNLNSKITELNKKVSDLEKQVDEYKNGPDRRLAEIKNLFEKKDYDKVISLTKELSELHPGSAQATEAKKLSSQAEKVKADEKKKADEEASKTISDKVKSLIRIKSVSCSTPNSANGVDLFIVWQNKSNKDVKYAYFIAEAYNAVGDTVQCQIRRDSKRKCQVTGPIKPEEWFGNDGRRWENAWYNNTIVKAVITEIELTYMDGTTETIKDDDVNYAIY